MASVATN